MDTSIAFLVPFPSTKFCCLYFITITIFLIPSSLSHTTVRRKGGQYEAVIQNNGLVWTRYYLACAHARAFIYVWFTVCERKSEDAGRQQEITKKKTPNLKQSTLKILLQVFLSMTAVPAAEVWCGSTYRCRCAAECFCAVSVLQAAHGVMLFRSHHLRRLFPQA